MSDRALAVRRANAAKGAQARESMDRYVQKIVDRAGELTPEHVDRLRSLLTPAGGAQE